MRCLRLQEEIVHKAVFFLVARKTEFQVWLWRNCQKHHQEFSRGKLQGRNKDEKGREEDDADEEGQEKRMEHEVMNEP